MRQIEQGPQATGPYAAIGQPGDETAVGQILQGPLAGNEHGGGAAGLRQPLSTFLPLQP
ncbi:MAG: hypothetical protein HOO20_09990 [Rhodospirillaceae bacterium]|nr:hypothetical protein [Rhodospirillaceae bacterium]MBT4743517.1 hypothetical protein [Rhodospirillaceae bacterium]